jgi:hypothetical protein
MTISGIQTHYLRCLPVSTIHPLKGPLVLPQEESGAFKLNALQWSFHNNHSLSSHWSIIDGHTLTLGRTTGSVSLIRQEIVPMSSPALKSIYGPVVYLFGYITLPGHWLQARCRWSALPAQAELIAQPVYMKYDIHAWEYESLGFTLLFIFSLVNL